MSKYYCDVCKYDAKQKSNYEKHIQTKKHTRKLENHVMDEYQDKETERYSCKFCDKSYKYRQGLSQHLRHTCKQKIYHEMYNYTNDIQEKIISMDTQNTTQNKKKIIDIFDNTIKLKEHILYCSKNYILKDL